MTSIGGYHSRDRGLIIDVDVRLCFVLFLLMESIALSAVGVAGVSTSEEFAIELQALLEGRLVRQTSAAVTSVHFRSPLDSNSELRGTIASSELDVYGARTHSNDIRSTPSVRHRSSRGQPIDSLSSSQQAKLCKSGRH